MSESEERSCHGLPCDTIIYTSRGQIPISELKEGDQLQHPPGEKATITTYLPREPTWSVYRTRYGFRQEGV